LFERKRRTRRSEGGRERKEMSIWRREKRMRSMDENGEQKKR
jgi:hypothetical protein